MAVIDGCSDYMTDDFPFPKGEKHFNSKGRCFLKKFSAVVFDLDGTLLDTLEDLGDAVNRVLADRGFPTHPMDAYRYFVGDGSAVLIEEGTAGIRQGL